MDTAGSSFAFEERNKRRAAGRRNKHKIQTEDLNEPVPALSRKPSDVSMDSSFSSFEERRKGRLAGYKNNGPKNLSSMPMTDSTAGKETAGVNGGGGNSISSSGSSKSAEERLQERLSGYIKNRPKNLAASIALNAKARKERVRQKLSSEHRSPSMPTPTSTNVGDIAFEEGLKPKSGASRNDHSEKLAPSLAMVIKAREERVRQKLVSERRSPSMPTPTSMDVGDAAFEEGLKGASRNDHSEKLAPSLAMVIKARDERVREKLGRSMPTSMNVGGAAFGEDPKSKSGASRRRHSEKLAPSLAMVIKAREERARQKIASEHRSASIPTSTMKSTSTSGTVRSDGKTNQSTDHKEGGDFFMEPERTLKDDVVKADQVSNVCFGDIFTDLYQFKKENGNLSIPLSHPSFLSIMDKFSSILEETHMNKDGCSPKKQRERAKVFKKKNVKADVENEVVISDKPTMGRNTMVKRAGNIIANWKEPGVEPRMEPIVEDNATSGAKSDDIAYKNLTLDQKIKLKKSRLKKSKDPRSSKERKRGMELSGTETYEKRMLQRSVLKGLGHQKSVRVLSDANEGKNTSLGINDGAKQNLQQYSGLVRSCSASNLCPGSWECTNCTYINEPVGLNPYAACKVCNEPNIEIIKSSPKSTSNRKSLSLSDVFLDSKSASKPQAKDDISVNIISWSELDAVIAVTALKSAASMGSSSGLLT